MKRIYVAGSYSANNVIAVLDNMRKGMRYSLKVLLAGYSPFVPWFDFHFQLMLRDGENLTVEDYYRYSMAWLEVSDAVFVLPNSENSKGTQAEIARAKELGIPVYYEFSEIKLGVQMITDRDGLIKAISGFSVQTPKGDEYLIVVCRSFLLIHYRPRGDTTLFYHIFIC